MIIDSHHPKFYYKHEAMKDGKFNGGFYYAQEIEKNIIPRVKTGRNWVTLNVEGECYDHSIIFIHSNINLESSYGWLKDYENLVLVCSNHDTQKYMEKFGKSIFLPLSVDVDYVKKFRVSSKTEQSCYAGNMWKFKGKDLARFVPKDTHCFVNLPREELLPEIAKYKECYAIGRTAIEAKILGCEIKVCDSRYPDPNFWQVLDNKEAAKMLQNELDKIDKC